MREVSLPGGRVLVHGHWGRPVLMFPSEAGNAHDAESNGLVSAAGDLLTAGRVKLYCVDSYDSASWSASHLPVEERAREHERYEDWIVHTVAKYIVDDCGGGDVEIATAGCSMGAYHALNIALRHADTFVLALCFSGNYDTTSWRGWGEHGMSTYFNNPVSYVPNLHGSHLEWLRSRLSVLLVCGQGQWEDTTGSLESTKWMAALLRDKGIRCELDLWGHDVPHDWPSWRRQWAHHLPRFC
ncbi:MAG TPA: alpha/beta hydrolase-fold protein [Actinophytocola sp.]|jgi:esterase/lipase superfamily enzyme|uniref:esterase family protein n=1 Tax=Actinophytocola sp. TaxID=1872138 RepID=UPI002E02378E|nr:alpha/beta hydrolase-fold protein [Actinophytocola sp.]